jgi:hypothetical protein
MSTEKILHRLQAQINDLMPSFELFVDSTIQPTVSDCEKLQQQLCVLQEQLAIYKYHKQDKELSPSFNLHARISGTVAEEKNVAAALEESAKTAPSAITTPSPAQPVAPPKQAVPEKEVKNEHRQQTKSAHHESSKSPRPLTIGVNDKFRFINELFAQNSPEYHIAMEQLSNLNNWSDTEIYLNSLRNLYGWKDNSEAVKYFIGIVKKRFQ